MINRSRWMSKGKFVHRHFLMEYWRQCVAWLMGCKVLPLNHRLTSDNAQVFDLAQMLRDGVLLCQLLNNLRKDSIDLKQVNLRPQMSQFLCLKNIRTFLTCCSSFFGMKKSDLFDPFDLFDLRDFTKVMDTLSKLSYTVIAQQGGFKPFPTEDSLKDEDIYNHLEDLIDENAMEDEDDLYAAVYNLEEDYAGGEIYEDLMRTEQQKQVEMSDVRSCCLSEIKQTEEKYTETLESIEKCFLNPLKNFFSVAEIDQVFVNIPDLVKVHKSLMADVQDSILNKNALNLYQIFISYKERLLIYGVYCSRVEIAIAVLDLICKEKEDVRLKLEECSKRANKGKFTLRDLLVVPMQRVLKYHLLLQELLKHTHDSAEKSNLKIALDAMKDLAQFVNELKRDNETIREMDQYQRSIENLNQPLIRYGRPRGDGEMRIVSNFDRRKLDRHLFLFDVAAVVCKRRGDNYEMKDVLDLNVFKITDNPLSDKEGKKWCYGFYVTHQQGHTGFELFFKTRELKKKWLDQFEMAVSNIRPELASHNAHQFKMHTFDRISSCSFCHLLLKGVFNQGYICLKCARAIHKECLGQLGICRRAAAESSKHGFRVTLSPTPQEGNTPVDPGLPRMLVIRAYDGVPCPPCGPPLSAHPGDVIELMFADLHSSWWQGRIPVSGKIGFFPSDAVRPCPCLPKRVDYSSQLWFAGPMERCQAEMELRARGNSTYLVRHRSKECTEYAISIKFNDRVKHIKILTKEGYFYITESRPFKTLLDLVEYYKQHSLKEDFSSLDSNLSIPYRQCSDGNSPWAISETGSVAPGACCFLPPSSSPFWSVFSPRVLSVAVARYDFNARDVWELSLLRGDVVNIYTKTSNGWWKGELGGKAGWFPSTYVEEED
ncbi:guanine nucleotide exchange factor VAV3-like isoform X1 [Stigmatopora nigra]